MKFRMQQKHVIDFIFPLAVFFVFALSSLSVLVLAARIYSSQTADATDNYMARTSLSYINEKIRQNDTAEGVSIQTLEGKDVLALKSSFDGVGYTTYIYEYEGNLKELFIRDGVDIRLKDIMEIRDFQMEEAQEGCFRFSSRDLSGHTSTLVSVERSMP